MALQAKVVDIGAQQMTAVTTVWFMADVAALFENRIVKDFLLTVSVRLVTMARFTHGHGIRFQESNRLPCVGIVTGSAVPLCPRVSNFRAIDFLYSLVMASRAERANAILRQADPAILGRLMTDFTSLVRKWRMHVRLHQLGEFRLMRVVALRAVGGCKRLALVSFD